MKTIEEEIHDRLMSASFHYADDTTQEWSIARTDVNSAAALIKEHDISEMTIDHLYKQHQYLVTKDELYRAIRRFT